MTAKRPIPEGPCFYSRRASIQTSASIREFTVYIRQICSCILKTFEDFNDWIEHISLIRALKSTEGFTISDASSIKMPTRYIVKKFLCNKSSYYVLIFMYFPKYLYYSYIHNTYVGESNCNALDAILHGIFAQCHKKCMLIGSWILYFLTLNTYLRLLNK